MKTITTFAALLLTATMSLAGGTGEIKGTVKNAEGELIFTANVKIFSNGTFIGGAQTDINGIYTYKPLNPGAYDVEISYINMNTYKIENVKVTADQAAYADAKLEVAAGTVVIITAEWNPPIIDRRFTTMDNIKSEQIEHMPDNGSIIGIITNVSSSVIPTSDGKGIQVRGSRRDATGYLIDGERVFGNANIPAFAIANVTMVTGGVPAEYGDLSGGVVVITTKDFAFGAYEKRAMKREYVRNKKAEEVAAPQVAPVELD